MRQKKKKCRNGKKEKDPVKIKINKRYRNKKKKLNKISHAEKINRILRFQVLSWIVYFIKLEKSTRNGKNKWWKRTIETTRECVSACIRWKCSMWMSLSFLIFFFILIIMSTFSLRLILTKLFKWLLLLPVLLLLSLFEFTNK